MHRPASPYHRIPATSLTPCAPLGPCRHHTLNALLTQAGAFAEFIKEQLEADSGAAAALSAPPVPRSPQATPASKPSGSKQAAGSKRKSAGEASPAKKAKSDAAADAGAAAEKRSSLIIGWRHIRKELPLLKGELREYQLKVRQLACWQFYHDTDVHSLSCMCAARCCKAVVRAVRGAARRMRGQLRRNRRGK